MNKDGTTLMEILATFLKDNGYDGLCNPQAECGCSIDDLFPCGEYQHGDCIVAYLGCAEDDPEEDWFYLSKQDAEDSMQHSPAYLFTDGATAGAKVIEE